MKKAFTGEGLPLMKVSGQGDVFLAHEAWDVHLIDLEEESLTVNGANVLAFEPTLGWDIKRIQGFGGMVSGGLFNTVFTGRGRVAVACHGAPVLLRVDQPTFVDTQAAVAWSSSLEAGIRSTVKAGAFIGRGSGEAFQLALEGRGFVLVQASEGAPAPPVADRDTTDTKGPRSETSDRGPFLPCGPEPSAPGCRGPGADDTS